MPGSHGLQIALDLFEAAEALMRQNLKRAFPGVSEEEIESRVVKWLQERPGAPHGDAPGNPRPWPDQRS